MKKSILLIIILSAMFLTSCSRYFSPEYAATHRMKCGTGIGKR
jgi:PBP1b-binding outer membrane lipoprotein LpoB